MLAASGAHIKMERVLKIGSKILESFLLRRTSMKLSKVSSMTGS